MGWLTWSAELISRLPWERMVIKEPDRTESLKRLQKVLSPRTAPKTSSSPALTPRPGVPDDVLLKDAYHRLKFEGVKLRKHLSDGCRIGGMPCDCCEKGIINLDHALEDILAVDPHNQAALTLQEWANAHIFELAAYSELSKERGLELAAELRLHLKACGAITEAPPTPVIQQPVPIPERQPEALLEAGESPEESLEPEETLQEGLTK